MSAVPRPIPIVLGEPVEGGMVQVTLRVIERGHDDLYVTNILTVRGEWREHLTPLLDNLIHRARLEVGTRHGTWICHVMPAPPAWMGALVPPPIAPRIRHREPHIWRTIAYDGRVDITPEVIEREGLPW